MSSPAENVRPDWLRVRLRATPDFERVRDLVVEKQLNTVCFSAACPNLGECWSHGTATFMIGGNTCTRACGFCDVATGRPAALDLGEPVRVAQAVEELGLRFAVVTAVARDDLAELYRKVAPGDARGRGDGDDGRNGRGWISIGG